MKRFASLLCTTAIAVLALTAKPAHSQTAAFNPNDGNFNFGTVQVGSASVPGIISFYRTNVIPLTNVTVTGVTLSDPANYSILDECTGAVLLSPADPTVPNRSFCRVSVVFHPTVAGAIPAATVSIASNATGSPHVFNLAGTGVASDIDVTLDPLVDAAVGTDAPAVLGTVVNNGSAPLALGALSIVGTDFTNFALSNDNCTNLTLAPGADCIFEVIFSPDAARTFEGQLNVPSDDPAAPNFQVLLSATGLSPTISATTPVVADTVVGTTSLSDLITITNNGSVPLQIGQLALVGQDPGNYSLNNDNCSNSTVAAGDFCFFEYTFSPNAVRTFEASVSIPSNDLSNPNYLVPLTADGLDGQAVSINPVGPIDFFDVGLGSTSLPRLIQFTNSGTTNLNVGIIDFINGFDYLLVGNTCDGAVLAPGAGCVVEVVCKPTATGLLPADSIQIISDALSGPTSVALECTGVVGPAVSVNPVDVNFGDVAVGRSSVGQAVQISNSGTTALNLTSVSVTTGTDFAITSNTCNGNTLAVGGSCQVVVACSPTATGALSDSLTILSDAAINPTVDLDCNGIQAVLDITGDDSFGNVNVGQVGGPNTLTVTNNGTDDVALAEVKQVGANPSQFEVSNDACSLVILGPGESCDFDVSFTPSAGGSFSDELLVGNAEISSSVTVTGSGIVPVPPGVGLLQIKTDVMNFAVDVSTSSSQSTTVTNIGDGAVQINSLNLEGDAAFTQVNDCDGQTLAPGASCTITVTFAAGGTPDNFNAVVTIDSNPETTAFLVLLGSSSSDEIGGGGCSLGNAGQAMSLSWMWLGLVPAFATGVLRRRAR